MIEINTEYRGVKIQFNCHSEEWVDDTGDLKDKSLTALKSKIDALIKGNFKPVKVLVYRGWNSDKYVEALVTTVDKHDGVWVTYPDGKREKINRDIILLNDKNKAQLARIRSFDDAAVAARNMAEEEYKKLEFFRRDK